MTDFSSELRWSVLISFSTWLFESPNLLLISSVLIFKLYSSNKFSKSESCVTFSGSDIFKSLSSSDRLCISTNAR